MVFIGPKASVMGQGQEHIMYYMYTCIVQHIFKAFCQSSMNLDQEGLLIEPIEGQQQNWNVESEKVFQEIKR